MLTPDGRFMSPLAAHEVIAIAVMLTNLFRWMAAPC